MLHIICIQLKNDVSIDIFEGIILQRDSITIVFSVWCIFGRKTVKRQKMVIIVGGFQSSLPFLIFGGIQHLIVFIKGIEILKIIVADHIVCMTQMDIIGLDRLE